MVGMKHNKSYDGEDFERYQEYLRSIRSKFPEAVFNFASNPNRHDFSGQSLHDSRVKSIRCSCNSETDETDILMVLLNAYFDKEFHLRFHKVSQYKIIQQNSDAYRGLITFEIAIERDYEENERIVFRAVFSGDDSEIEVYSEQMHIEEKDAANG